MAQGNMAPAARPGMLDGFFKLAEHGTNVRTEVIAGVTTFLTMAYIIFVNPDILSKAGMPRDAVFVATCVAAAIGTLLMAFLANYPIALAPGMGLNAYFAFGVVLGMKFTWQVALGCVFISGVIFLILSVLPVREWIVNAIPKSLKMAIAAGIGLFLALIALQGAESSADPSLFFHLRAATHYELVALEAARDDGVRARVDERNQRIGQRDAASHQPGRARCQLARRDARIGHREWERHDVGNFAAAPHSEIKRLQAHTGRDEFRRAADQTRHRGRNRLRLDRLPRIHRRDGHQAFGQMASDESGRARDDN